MVLFSLILVFFFLERFFLAQRVEEIIVMVLQENT